uniref:DUF4220 domain-containing protein n=1 Tax=Leersia perrieri TaxID=77586 RepID=A0A0D9XUU5_9ORYZ
MRILWDNQLSIPDHRRYQLISYPPAVQHSLVTHIQQLWNGWEIQCLAILSFSLQVFLLFSTIFRKRNYSRVLRMLLWLAYLSADAVAIYLLGRLTLLVGDEPQHQLVLFWAPFLLLHLGGQESIITAFSMEDRALWKRHLLNLVIQVSLAIYVIGKQWRGDKQLVAPTAIMFVAGTISYAERIYVLSRAHSAMSVDDRAKALVVDSYADIKFYACLASYDRMIRLIISEKQGRNSERVMEAAREGFLLSLDFLLDLTAARTGDNFTNWQSTSNQDLVDMLYKLAEIHLSMIYDYLYTKFGMGMSCRLATLALTCIALVLFLVSRLDPKGSVSYYRTDAIISYILLVGAIVLEISSTLLWLMSSFLAWNIARFSQFTSALPCADTISLHNIVKIFLPEISRVEWSEELQQHNIIDWCICIKKRKAGDTESHYFLHACFGRLERMMDFVGIERGCTKPVKVSADLKKVILDNLLKIWGIVSRPNELEMSRFHGLWAHQWVQRCYQYEAPISGNFAPRTPSDDRRAAERALGASGIQDLGFVDSVFIWHLVTDICQQLEDDTAVETTSKLRSLSSELSDYAMYLIVKCQTMLGSKYELDKFNFWRTVTMRFTPRGKVDRSAFIQNILTCSIDCDVFVRACCVSRELLKMEVEPAASAGRGRWELITVVWTEMLCYIAKNCGTSFHTKQLCAGGEFVTHVKMLLFVLGFVI